MRQGQGKQGKQGSCGANGDDFFTSHVDRALVGGPPAIDAADKANSTRTVGGLLA